MAQKRERPDFIDGHPLINIHNLATKLDLRDWFSLWEEALHPRPRFVFVTHQVFRDGWQPASVTLLKQLLHIGFEAHVEGYVPGYGFSDHQVTRYARDRLILYLKLAQGCFEKIRRKDERWGSGVAQSRQEVAEKAMQVVSSKVFSSWQRDEDPWLWMHRPHWMSELWDREILELVFKIFDPREHGHFCGWYSSSLRADVQLKEHSLRIAKRFFLQLIQIIWGYERYHWSGLRQMTGEDQQAFAQRVHAAKELSEWARSATVPILAAAGKIPSTIPYEHSVISEDRWKEFEQLALQEVVRTFGATEDEKKPAKTLEEAYYRGSKVAELLILRKVRMKERAVDEERRKARAELEAAKRRVAQAEKAS